MSRVIRGGWYLVGKLTKIYLAFILLGFSAGLLLNPKPKSLKPQQPMVQRRLAVERAQTSDLIVQRLPVTFAPLPTAQLPTEVEQSLSVAPLTSPDTQQSANSETKPHPQLSPFTLLPEDEQTVDNVVGKTEAIYGWNFNSLANGLALSPELAEQMKTRIFDYFSEAESNPQRKTIRNFLAEIVPEFVGEDVAKQYFAQAAESKQVEAQNRTLELAMALTAPIGLAPEQEAAALQIISEAEEEARQGVDFFDTELKEARFAFLKGEIDEFSYLLQVSVAEVSNQALLDRTVKKLLESPDLVINDQQRNDLLALSGDEELAELLTSRVCRNINNSDCSILPIGS